jgi:hypothetical protein
MSRIVQGYTLTIQYGGWNGGSGLQQVLVGVVHCGGCVHMAMVHCGGCGPLRVVHCGGCGPLWWVWSTTVVGVVHCGG